MLRASLLLLAVIAGLVSCQTDFSGVYPSSYCGTSTACSAEFAICHDLGTGLLQGRYSRVGFIYGTVTNDTFTGNWFESGVAGPLINPAQSTYDAYPNNGPLTLTFVVAGSSISFSGTAYYEGGVDVHFTWNVPSTIPTPATSLTCWSAPVASPTLSLNSGWAVDPTRIWPMCVTDGNYTVGSFTSGAATTGITGISIGPCYLNGSLCTFDFVEETSSAYNLGIGLARRSGTSLYTIRWYMPASLNSLDVITMTNWGYQLNSLEETSWVATPAPSGSPYPAGCADYYLLLGSAAAMRASIVMVIVAALLCVFTL